MLVPKLQVFTIQIAVIPILAVLKTLMEDQGGDSGLSERSALESGKIFGLFIGRSCILAEARLNDKQADRSDHQCAQDG